MESPYEVVNIKPFEFALSMIEGKWKMNILFWLWQKKIMRYSELQRSLGNITHKVLSDKLKDLEKDGLIIRHEYPQVPPKVEYYLSEKGKSLMPILHEICKWGTEQLGNNEEEKINP